MEIANRPAFGPACMLCYVGLFVATNAVTKSLSASLPVVEIALFRYAVAVPVVIVVVAFRHDRARMNSPALHMLRGILAAVGSVCGYFAMATLPLGDATALFFLSPLLVTAGAAFVLDERPDVVRALCVVTGFFGVLMIAQPHFAGQLGVVAGIANAVCAAAGVLLIRDSRKKENALSLALSTSIVCLIALCLPAAAVWLRPSATELVALLALGVMGGLATVLLNFAYQNAPAPLLAGIDYLSVPGSLMAGALLWDERPAVLALAGAAVVVAAGLVSLRYRGGAGERPKKILLTGATPAAANPAG